MHSVKRLTDHVACTGWTGLRWLFATFLVFYSCSMQSVSSQTNFASESEPRI